MNRVVADEAKLAELRKRREKRVAHTDRARHRQSEFHRDIERTKRELANQGGRREDDAASMHSWDPLTRILSRRRAANPYHYH
jgi:hypothetical protein